MKISDDQFAAALNEYQFNGGNTYLTEKGKAYTLEKSFGMVTAHTPSGRRAGAMTFSESRHTPGDSTIGKVAVSGPHQRKGVASAMMDYARQNGAPNLHHSSVLTADGKRFASSTPRAWQPQLGTADHPRDMETGSVDWRKTIDFTRANENSRIEFDMRLRESHRQRNAPTPPVQQQLDLGL